MNFDDMVLPPDGCEWTLHAGGGATPSRSGRNTKTTPDPDMMSGA